MEPVIDGKHEQVDTKTLIEDVLPYFTEQAISRNLTIETDIDDAPVLNASKSLAEIMINNPILNAIAHNRINGSISIRATNKQLQICNTSEQPELNAESLFKRFGKISRAGNSSGLDLAIIKQICELHYWQVSYSWFKC